MARYSKALVIVVLVVALMLIGTSSGLMAPAEPLVTFDSIRVECGTGTSSNQAVAITAQNVGANGIAGFDLNVQFDHTLLQLDSVEKGSDWNAFGCGNFISVGFDDGTYAWITSACTTAPGSPALTGSNLEIARLNFSKVGGGDIGPYSVTLNTTGVGVPTGLIGPDNVKAEATSGQLLVACTPTAVELSDMSANSASPATALALWPLLAGGAAVAAGGAFVALRRKR